MFHHLNQFIQYRVVRATGLVFIAIGLIFGTWTAFIPTIKARFALDEAQLGLLLLCLPAGVILMNPFSVPLLRFFGASRLTRLFVGVSGIVFIFPVLMPQVWLVGVVLFLAGISFSITNIAMNTCASILEQKAGRNIIASCHGLWSLGAMLGALITGTLAGWGIPPAGAMGMLCILIGFLSWWIKKPLMDLPEEDYTTTTENKKASGFIWPNKALWLLITISLCVYLTEGTMADWSAVYMRELLQRPESQVGLGFGIYAFFMASGRFLGDELIAKVGSKRVLQYGGGMAAIGFLLLVVQPLFGAILLGFAMVGMGVSLGAPILYATAAKVPGLPPGAGLATMNTFAMGAFLGGPALIGFLAKWQGLAFAFGIVGLCAFLWALQARWMKG